MDWIPRENRSPKKDGKYICYVSFDEHKFKDIYDKEYIEQKYDDILIAFWENGEFILDFFTAQNFNVSYWMELPPFPKLY